jgi:hypothetical protein
VGGRLFSFTETSARIAPHICAVTHAETIVDMRLHALSFCYIPELSADRAATNSAKYFSGCLSNGRGFVLLAAAPQISGK